MEGGTTTWSRIEAVVVYYRFRSVNAFAKHIGLRRAENLYRIKNGRNRLSHKLSETICSHFPDVSRGWLLTGEGRMMVEKIKKQSENDGCFGAIEGAGRAGR